MEKSYIISDFTSLTSTYVDIGNLHKTIRDSIPSINYIGKSQDIYTVYFTESFDETLLDSIIGAYDGTYETNIEVEEKKEEESEYQSNTTNVSAENYKADDGTLTELSYSFNTNNQTGIYLGNNNMTLTNNGNNILDITPTYIGVSNDILNYESLVVSDNIIPNKKYVDDKIVQYDAKVATLTNKTINSATNSVTADSLRSSLSSVCINTNTPTTGQVLIATSATNATWQTMTSGAGDMSGPTSSLDNEIVVFNGLTGKISKGAGIRHYGASATDPTSPTPNAGDKYYNTVINHEMCYDGNRGKWLSVAILLEGIGTNGNVKKNNFYRRFNGMTTANALGSYVPKGTIIGIGFATANAVSHVFEVQVDGSLVSSMSSDGNSSKIDMTINDDFLSGILSFKNKSSDSSTTARLQATIYYKLRV